MNQRIRAAHELWGQLIVPGDKSISHRALICNSLASGQAEITNLSPGADCASTISCLRALGVRVETYNSNGTTVTIDGCSGQLEKPSVILDAGNSGTTMRLLSGLIAGQGFCAEITGDLSLKSRPMERIVLPLNEMGARVTGANNDTRPPLKICGANLHGITYSLPVASAQLKSCLMLAAIQADSITSLINPASSRDHTERMLSAMGGNIAVDANIISVTPGTLEARDIRIPGDISSAAFWIVAALIHPRAHITLPGVGVNPSRTGVLDILRRMGAKIKLNNLREVGNEPIADIEVESSALRSVELGGSEIPGVIDELPILAVAACFATGKTVIKDAYELRAKESDRIHAMVTGLTQLGANVEELRDGMAINGPATFRGGTGDSNGDHRIAMALAVAGLTAGVETIIRGSDCVDISYPTFWQDLEILAPGSTA